MATTEVFYNGDGSDLTFTIPFEYLEESDVKVSVGGTLKTQDTDYTFSTLTEITFTTAPPSGTNNVRIFRDTDIESLRNEFFAGSAIRAQDLNDDFLQTLYTVQEIEDQFVTQTNGSFDGNVDMNSNRITELADPVDAQDAVTKQYLEDNYFDDGTETILSNESWPDNDLTIATTASIDNRIDSKIDTAITSDIAADSSGITVTDDGDGTITLGLGAGSIDLDRIKDADIVTSAETNPNNDTTIATTAKIDDMIDAAITGDIAVDSTGLTLTDDGDGTITLGIGAGAVDLDRIKAGDIINLAEQNAGPTTADGSIFTSSAAAKRFDTLVQLGTPSGSDYQVGKTWLQNDDDLTLSIWNGSGWTAVSSGGAFREQTNVVYVDPTGDNASTGHRISSPKETIKAAIEQINAEIDTELTSGGSGYAEGSYSNVALTGGNGTGLTANITVNASGVVTAVTINSAATLEDYSIGDVLSASNTNLGGSGSGLQITVTGDGDGQIVIVAAGAYPEVAPIQIKRRNVSIIGQSLRSCIVHPTSATETNTLFELNSGSYISNLTLTGVKAGTGTGNALDATLPTTQGWNFAFYEDAYITKSPYIQNCTNFSDSEIENDPASANYLIHRPAGGQAGDIDSDPTGGGMLVNGATPHDDSPLRSMVADSYTHVALNGPGILVVNNGYTQITSSYAFFNRYHIKCLTGGQANLAASTTDFGTQALVADGQSTDAIFTATVATTAADEATTFTIGAPTAGASWHGTATRPANNMLVQVNNNTYPILSATANGAGWDVEISRPDPTDRSNNLGLNGTVPSGATALFTLRSQIASSGHTMEYVGSGTNYTALPENGGIPIEANQVVESNNGKIWTATTDHNGKFKVGDFFEVDQQLGFVTIPEGSIAFNVLSDTTPQLGGDLDVNGNTITGLPNAPSADGEAASKKYVDDQVGAITGSTDLSYTASTRVIASSTGTDATLPEVTAGGDSGLMTGADKTKLDGIAASANNYSHPNHTGEVTSTGDGATVITDNIVDEANLKVSNDPTDGYVLTARSANTGGMTWEAVAAGTSYPEMGASGTNRWAVVHSYTVDDDYSIPSGSHVINAGPMIVNSGVTVTIPTGSNWVIV
jgi:hypothetical protein